MKVEDPQNTTVAPSGKRTGAKNNNWKGGRSVASSGYMLVRVGVDHHLADVRGYAYEHRIVAEVKIGRRLQKGEHVHHVDGDKLNNDPSNIEVLTHAEHLAKHRTADNGLRVPGQDNPSVLCACGCGASFRRFDRLNRPRQYVSGHNSGHNKRADTGRFQGNEG